MLNRVRSGGTLVNLVPYKGGAQDRGLKLLESIIFDPKRNTAPYGAVCSMLTDEDKIDRF